jgi:hypothetical protein
MRTALLIGASLLFISLAAVAKPDRNDDTPKKAPPMPDLMLFGETNWGTLIQTGKRVELRNHPTWEADGEWRYRQGQWELLLLWTLNADGTSGPGLYTLKDGKLVGHWNYESAVTRNEDGSIAGLSREDTIFRPTR